MLKNAGGHWRKRGNDHWLQGGKSNFKWEVVVVYLVHRIVAHRAVVVRLRAIIATVYAHPVSGHVLRATRWRRRHHRRRGALAGTTHTVRRRSCKSCCRNNRGAYKIRGCVFLSSSASPIHFVYRKKCK